MTISYGVATREMLSKARLPKISSAAFVECP